MRASVAGKRDPHRLATLRTDRCRQAAREIAHALTGPWRDEPRCVLKPALALSDCSTAHVPPGAEALEHAYRLIHPDWGAAAHDAVPTQKAHSPSKHTPAAVPVRAPLQRITAVDVGAVHGISASLAQLIVSAIGTDMTRSPTEKAFCAWLGVASPNDLSGGNGRRSRPLKTHKRAGQAVRQAAAAGIRADCAVGAFSCRLKNRLGPAQAVVATAHTIAQVVFPMVQY